MGGKIFKKEAAKLKHDQMLHFIFLALLSDACVSLLQSGTVERNAGKERKMLPEK